MTLRLFQILFFFSSISLKVKLLNVCFQISIAKKYKTHFGRLTLLST